MTAEAENGSSKEATLLERIGQLEKQLEQVAKGNRDVRGSSSRKAGSKKEGSGRGQSDPKNVDKVRPNPETHPCTFCKEMCHWCRECPKRKAKGEAKRGRESQSEYCSVCKC